MHIINTLSQHRGTIVDRDAADSRDDALITDEEEHLQGQRARHVRQYNQHRKIQESWKDITKRKRSTESTDQRPDETQGQM